MCSSIALGYRCSVVRHLAKKEVRVLQTTFSIEWVMDNLKVTSVLSEWRGEVRIEPKEMVALSPRSRQGVFLWEGIRVSLPKTPFSPKPQAGSGSQAKHSRCRLLPESLFVLLIAWGREGAPGFFISAQVPDQLSCLLPWGSTALFGRGTSRSC